MVAFLSPSAFAQHGRLRARVAPRWLHVTGSSSTVAQYSRLRARLAPRWLHVTGSSRNVVGIRAEDAKRVWERRAPLTPDAVEELVSGGARVLVQSCEKRIFPDAAYRKVRISPVPDRKELTQECLGWS